MGTGSFVATHADIPVIVVRRASARGSLRRSCVIRNGFEQTHKILLIQGSATSTTCDGGSDADVEGAVLPQDIVGQYRV